MTDEENNSSQVVGRTWADVTIGASYILFTIAALAAAGGLLYLFLGNIPQWFIISVVVSFGSIPFITERIKADCEEYIVSHDPFNLTILSVGKKAALNVEGVPTLFSSDSGYIRKMVTHFDRDTLTVKASNFGDFSQIDQVRDMSTLQRLHDKLMALLKEDRLTAQTLGIEVEYQSREIVDWALKTIYGSIIPTEVSEAFGIDSDKAPDLEESDILEALGVDDEA
jgi:hypothetical protein